MRFRKLAEVLEELEKTSSNNKMQEIAAKFFKKVPAKDIRIVSYFMLGETAPAFADANLGMAEKMVLKAIAKATGKKEKRIMMQFRKQGDIGLTAERFNRKHGNLTVRYVFKQFNNIVKASGAGSRDIKIKILAELFHKSGGKEARYLARIVVGKLRLGASIKTIIYALAIAFTGSKKNKDEIEQAYEVNPDIGDVAEQIAKHGLKGAKTTRALIGRPIKMMLCQRIKALEEIKEKMAKFSIEEKLDGERIQAHCDGKKIILFSRRMEDITKQYPDVAASCRKSVKAKQYIIEGEAIPVDSRGRFRPFQLLMKRRRKYNVKKYAKEIPVCYFVFDVLYWKGRPYMHKPYLTRRRIVEKIIRNGKEIQVIRNKISTKIGDIKRFFNWSTARGSEGVVIKSCGKHSVYRAGIRVWQWIKWKKEYIKGMQDMFDLAVVGAFAGKGRRKGTYGALLCAAYNAKKKRFETFCKLGSGFTGKQLKELPNQFKRCIAGKQPKNVDVVKEMKPDYWIKPKIVVEVLGSEITKSPVHSCGREKGKGLALRFPRFIRYREDKSAVQATTVKEIKQMAK